MRPEMYPSTSSTPVHNEVIVTPAKKSYAHRFLTLSIVTYGLIALLFLIPYLLVNLSTQGEPYGALLLSMGLVITIIVVDVIIGIRMVITGMHYLKREQPVGKRRIATIASMSIFSLGVLYLITRIVINIVIAQYMTYIY